MSLFVAIGALWSAAILMAAAVLAALFPSTAAMVRGAGLAVCTALAANKMFEASQAFRCPNSEELFRKALAQGVGAFLVIVVGTLISFH